MANVMPLDDWKLGNILESRTLGLVYNVFIGSFLQLFQVDSCLGGFFNHQAAALRDNESVYLFMFNVEGRRDN